MRLQGISDVGICRIAEAIDGPVTMEEMREHFIDRTNKHISLVQKYCERIYDRFKGFEGILERGDEHDQSKFEEPELTPYIYLTWRYKCEDDGKDCILPEGMEEKINEATLHHIINNSHHAEFFDSLREEIVNEEDRDKPAGDPIDASKMTALDIAEMVADWCAMGEELGSHPKDWADENIGIRWVFTPTQEDLIYGLIEGIFDDD